MVHESPEQPEAAEINSQVFKYIAYKSEALKGSSFLSNTRFASSYTDTFIHLIQITKFYIQNSIFLLIG